ncbi:hypothetical protein [Elizabethkingia meningoseptica]|uniref:hypothetical protein n=1 Tax=Elizabethkingia meningoseptica TaxID=238 RepID=UPI00293C6BC3|nr:hypothetical protein [Elizabethkingia anophelis]
MKTKYIAVPVSERLPDEEELYLVRSKQGFISEMKFYKDEEWLWKSSKDYWLEEKEDHSEEMKQMIEEMIFELDPSTLSGSYKEVIKKAKQLINKVKQ